MPSEASSAPPIAGAPSARARPDTGLTARRDGPAALHLAIQIAATGAAFALTISLAASGHPLRWLGVAILGVCVLTFFPLLHEAGHSTAFASRRANEAATWLGALFMLQAPSFFREFHWAHHRSTQSRESDPEIANAPGLLDDYPRDPLRYAFLACGQFLMVGKLLFTIACAMLPTSMQGRLFPFIRAERRTRVAWESRLALVVFAGVAAVCAAVPAAAFALLAWPIAHGLLGFYLMPEHTGLPNDGTQVHRTRTVLTPAWVRWLMWNMPYHAEHHAYPGVPYHALPALHARMVPELEHVSAGYLAFHGDAMRRAVRLR